LREGEGKREKGPSQTPQKEGSRRAGIDPQVRKDYESIKRKISRARKSGKPVTTDEVAALEAARLVYFRLLTGAKSTSEAPKASLPSNEGEEDQKESSSESGEASPPSDEGEEPLERPQK
jgi:hypothetical protein